MNLNYKGLINILGLQKWMDRVITLETTVANLPTVTPDGNGLYDGSGDIQPGTLATLVAGDGSVTDFAIGRFPNWPNFSENSSAKGLVISPDYYGAIGLYYGTSSSVYSNVYVTSSGATILERNASNTSSVVLSGSAILRSQRISDNNITSITCQPANQVIDFQTGDFAVSLKIGSGSPEGIVTASIGSFYFNKAGGASTTLYIKTSGSGNTGWTAK